MGSTCTEISDSQRRAIFATLVTTCVALALLSTALYTALPPLISDLGVSLSAGQWVTSGYALALAVMTPLTAFLSTRFPTRPLYLAALACFLAGTLMSALAPSFVALMVGRVVQASANALVANVTQVSIMTLYPAEQRGRAMGWFGLATGAAPVAAPALGGLVVDLWGWRMVFWVVGALCLAGFISALVVIRNVLDATPKPFDGVSFVLSLATFGGLTLGLGNVAAAGFSLPLVGAPLAVALIAGVPFVRRQVRSAQPFLKIQILGGPDFRAAVVASMLLYAAMMGASAVLPMLIQGHLGLSATISGLVVLPGAAATALVSPMAGRLYDRWGIAPLTLIGGVAMAVSCAVVCIPVVTHSLVALALANMVRCLAVGCLTMPLMTWGNSSVDGVDMPHASALLTSLRNLAGALGVAIVVGVFDVAGPALGCGSLALCGGVISLCARGKKRASRS